MKNKIVMYRQGDLLIERIETEIPVDAKPVTGRPILAHGEVTGHCHEVEEAKAVRLYAVPNPNRDNMDAALKFAEITAPTRIVHQEHAPIALEPGRYRILRQREYSPEEIRRVQD